MKQQHQRNRRGASAVELAVGSVFLLVLTLFCVDATVMLLANGVNNEACRDAARAAASAPPTSARQCAQQALKSHQQLSDFIRSLTVDTFVYNNVPPYGQADAADPTNQPTVYVGTTLTVRLPASILFFGAALTGTDGLLSFHSAYLYPILNVPANSVAGVFDPNHASTFYGPDPGVPGSCDNPPVITTGGGTPVPPRTTPPNTPPPPGSSPPPPSTNPPPPPVTPPPPVVPPPQEDL